MATEDQIQVVIQYVEEGRSQVAKSMQGFEKQMANLAKVNASMAMSTGKMFPQVSQQIAMINSLGTSIDSGAMKLAKLRQEGSMFSQVFSGNTRRNLAEINQELGFSGARGATSVFSRISRELTNVQAVAGTTTAHLRDLTAPERFRIMGHVFTETMHQSTMRMINWGKNMQWVGRQLMIGLTLPILYFAREVTQSFLTFNRAQTELQKYLYASGLGVKEFADAFKNDLLPAYERISLATGLYRDQVIEVSSAWAAAGYTIENGLIQYTDLTAQLQLLSQGEIDMANSIELVRSVQATWGYTTEETTEQLQKLNLVGNITSLTMQEIAEALPVVSSSAQILNIQASELSAVIAGMRERGVSASQAANTLKFSINRLINPTNKAEEAWAGLGKQLTGGKTLLDTLFDEEGMGRGVTGIEEIAAAIGQLPQSGQAQIAGILFGGYRADRMLKLIDAMNDSTSQYTQGMAAASDEARALSTWEEQLTIVQESSAQKFKIMRVELVTLAQKFGEFIFPYVEKFGRKILEMLKKLEDAPEIFKKVAVGITGILAAIGPVTYVFAQLTEAAGMLGRVFAVAPLQAMFSLTSMEDPFGLLALARGAGSANPAIQLLSGIPLAMDEISLSSRAMANEVLGSVTAFQQMGMIDANTANFLRFNAIKQGAFGGVPGLLGDLSLSSDEFGKLLADDSIVDTTTLQRKVDAIHAAKVAATQAAAETITVPPPMRGRAVASGLSESLVGFNDEARVAISEGSEAMVRQLDKSSGAVRNAAGEVIEGLVDGLDSPQGLNKIDNILDGAVYSVDKSGREMFKKKGFKGFYKGIDNMRDEIQRSILALSGAQIEWDDALKRNVEIGPTGMRTFAGNNLDDVLASRLGILPDEVDDLLRGNKSLYQIAGGTGLTVLATEDFDKLDNLVKQKSQLVAQLVETPAAVSAASLNQAANLSDEGAAIVAGWGEALAEGADDAARVATKVGEEVVEGIDESLTGSRATSQIAASSTTFWSRLTQKFSSENSKFAANMKALFTGQTLPLFAPPTQGGGVASSFILKFASPAKFIALIAGLIALVTEWDAISKGFSESIDDISESFKGIISSVTDFVAALTGSENTTSDANEAFYSLGQVVGDLASTILDGFEFVVDSLLGFMTVLARIGREAIGVIVNLIDAAKELLTLDIGDAVSSLLSALNPLNNEGSSLSKIISQILVFGSLSAVFGKISATVKASAAAFGAFRIAGSGIYNLAGALGAFTGKFRALMPLLGRFISPWTALIGVITSLNWIWGKFSNHVNEELVNMVGNASKFREAIEEVRDALAVGDTGEVRDFQAYFDAIKEASTLNIESNQSLYNQIAENAGLTGKSYQEAYIMYQSALKDIERIQKEQDDLKNSTPDAQDQIYAGVGPIAERYNQLQSDLEDARDVVNAFEDLEFDIRDRTKMFDALISDFATGIRADIDLDDYKAFMKGYKNEIIQAEEDVSNARLQLNNAVFMGLPESEIAERQSNLSNAERWLEYLERSRVVIQGTGIATKAYYVSALDELDARLKKVTGSTIDMKNASQELRDAIASQLSQLASRVQDSVLEAFDNRAEAQMEAFDDRAEDQMQAMEDRHERQLEMFDEDAEAQVDAIDDKIDALDEQDKKEQELQQKQELRQRRAELMREMELSDAMAFRERLKAIHEGRFDDAMLIELQMAENNRQQRKDLKDLADEEKQMEEDRRKERRREALEARRDKLQERLDKQREALQEQMEAEREALQERLDNQREALQDMLDQQRQTLQNMFTELNEELPKNERQWKRHYDAVAKIAEDWGIGMDDAQNIFMADWGLNFKEGLNDALEDAYNIAEVGGMQVANASHQGVNQQAIERDQADAQLYRVLQGYIQAQIDAQPEGLTPAQMLNWLGKIEEALKGTSRAAQSAASEYVPTSGNTPLPGVIRSQHTGGFIDGKPRSDIPAVLQEGEYVIQRSAVQRVGRRYLDHINKAKEYHSGGFVNLGSNLGNRSLADMIPRNMIHDIASQQTGGLAKEIARGAARSVARGIIRDLKSSLPSSRGGTIGTFDSRNYPQVDGPEGVRPDTYINQTFPRYEEPQYGARASTAGTSAVRNYWSQLNRVFPSAWNITHAGIYNRRYINNDPAQGWSQHAWGNAIDVVIGSLANVANNSMAQAKIDMIAGWTQANANALDAATVLWRANSSHMNHMHVDFWPQGGGTPPYLHNGGVFTKNGIASLGKTQFEAPAMLEYGETVLSRNVTNALARAGSSNEAGSVNITVEVQGDLYGDESSYRRLHSTLERVGSKIARERGGGQNTRVRIG